MVEAADTSGKAPVKSSTAIVLALCAAATLVEGFDIQSIAIVAPQYRAEFGISHQQQGLIFGLTNLGLFIGSIIAGWASDRVGRRWTAILSMVVFGLLSVGCAFASTGLQFTVLRFCMGLGVGGSLANIIAITAEAGSAKGRVVRVIIMSAWLGVGGATPGGILAIWPDLDWRAIYQLGGWAPILVGLLMYFLMPESAPYLKAKAEGQVQAAHGSFKANAFVALFKDGRAMATVILWVATFCTFLVYYLINNWLPSLMVAQSFSTRQASLSAVLFTGGGAVGTVILGLLIGMTSRRVVTIIAFGGCLAALCALALVSGFSVIMPVVFALGFFVTTAKNMLYGLAPIYYPVAIRGTGVGTALSLGRLGSIVGPAAAGLLLGGGAKVSTVLLSLIPVLVLATVSSLALSWVRSHDPE